MNWLFTTRLFLPFWASRGSALYELMLQSNDWSASRRVRALEPVLTNGDPLVADQPSPGPVRPIPTDVPVPDPHDIPVPEPMDVPPPDPGVPPKPAKSPPRPDPKPRPTP
jgi:hypothetical protein